MKKIKLEIWRVKVKFIRLGRKPQDKTNKTKGKNNAAKPVHTHQRLKRLTLCIFYFLALRLLPAFEIPKELLRSSHKQNPESCLSTHIWFWSRHTHTYAQSLAIFTKAIMYQVVIFVTWFSLINTKQLWCLYYGQ